MLGIANARWLLLLLLCPAPALAQSACPEELEPLVLELTDELPGYANRVIARSRVAGELPGSSYVMLAGALEFAPLPLEPPGVETPALDNSAEGIEQAFFTTWERTYREGSMTDLQSYHWLFLVRTERGWYLDRLFSRTGPYPAGGPISPPRESSRGTIGQAVRLWLRDCRARTGEVD